MVVATIFWNARSILANCVFAIAVSAASAVPAPLQAEPTHTQPPQPAASAGGIAPDGPLAALQFDERITERKPCIVQLPAMWGNSAARPKTESKTDMEKQRKQVKMGDNCKQ